MTKTAHVNSEDKDDEVAVMTEDQKMYSEQMTEDYARRHRYKAPPEGVEPRNSSSSAGVLEAKTPAKKPGKAPPTSLRHPASDRPHLHHLLQRRRARAGEIGMPQ